MKKQVLIFLFLPIFGFSQIQQQLNQTHLEENKLKGNISMVKIFHFDINYEEDTLRATPYSGSFGFSESKNHFNNKGFLTSIDYYNIENNLKVKTSTRLYFYGQGGRLDSVLTKSENTYNKMDYQYLGDSVVHIKSNITSKLGLLSSTKSTHELKNNIEKWQLKGDSFSRKNRFIYDNKNRILRKEEFHDTDSVQILTCFNYPDSVNPNPDKAIIYLPTESVTNIISYDYEKNGNLIKVETREIVSKTNEEIESFSTFNRLEYKFDEMNNWIEKREFFFHLEN